MRLPSKTYVSSPYQNVLVQFQTQALKCDGCRCVFSGRLDSASVDEGHVQEDDKSVSTVTELAHIFDWSTNEGLEDEKKVLYCTSIYPVFFLWPSSTSSRNRHHMLHQLWQF